MKTIAEKNKLIDEFMGVEPNKMEDIKYYSWDYLMSVIDKIESMKYFIETTSTQTSSSKWYMHKIKICDNTNTFKSFDNPIVCVESDYTNNESKKSVYYKAILEFIKWYNK